LDLEEVFGSGTVLNNIVLKKKIDPDTSFQISPTKKISEKVVSKCNPILQFQVTCALSQFIQNQPTIQAEQAVPIAIEGFEFRCLVDTGAAVSAASANMWTEFLRHVCPTFDDSDLENITSVNGSIIDSMGKTLMQFVTLLYKERFQTLMTFLFS